MEEKMELEFDEPQDTAEDIQTVDNELIKVSRIVIQLNLVIWNPSPIDMV